MLLQLEEEYRALETLRKATLFQNSGSSGNLTIDNTVLELGKLWTQTSFHFFLLSSEA